MTFDQTDLSNDDYPMLLSITVDGTHNGGTTYTLNVSYQLNNVVKTQSEYVTQGFGATKTIGAYQPRYIIIDFTTHDVEDFILHLYCPSTPGMGTGLTNRPNSGIITVGATNDKFGYFTVTDDMPYNRKKNIVKEYFLIIMLVNLFIL